METAKETAKDGDNDKKEKEKDLKPLHVQRQEDTPGTKARVSVVGLAGSSGRRLPPHAHISGQVLTMGSSTGQGNKPPAQ